MPETLSEVLRSSTKRALHLRPINLRFVLLLLCFITGCHKHPQPETEKMAVQTDTAKPPDSLRSGDNAAYIAMVRAENETDLGFKVGGIVDIIGPESGSDWNEGRLVKTGTVLARLKQP